MCRLRSFGNEIPETASTRLPTSELGADLIFEKTMAIFSQVQRRRSSCTASVADNEDNIRHDMKTLSLPVKLNNSTGATLKAVKVRTNSLFKERTSPFELPRLKEVSLVHEDQK